MARRSASLENLLRTNLPPSEREANVLDTRISDAYEALDGLNQEIGKVQTTLSSLQKAIFKLIAEYKLLLSPVRRLAPEILMEIFRWTTESIPEGNFYVTDPRSGPWVLSHVSNLWRVVALGCSGLWSCFTIRFLTPASRPRARTLAMLNTVLLRSGTCELCVVYDYADGGVRREEYMLLHALMVHSHRWKHVSLTLGKDMFEELQSVRGALGSLQSLEIDMTYERGTRKIIDTFEFAPRLNRIKYIGNSDGRKFILPWSQLTSYHEEKEYFQDHHSDSMPMLLSILKVTRKCTALEDLTVSSFSPLDHSHETSKVPHVSNDSIRHLTVQSDLIIPFLTLPSLQTLTLDFEARITPEAIANIRRLIQRSHYSLMALDLRRISPSKEVTTVLRCTPNLTQLAFSYGYSQWKDKVNRDFINLFKDVDACRGKLLPKLQSLCITVHDHTPYQIKVNCLDSEAFVRMIESWWQKDLEEEQSHTFKFITNSATPPASVRTLNRLQELKAKGMSISILAKVVGTEQEITYV